MNKMVRIMFLPVVQEIFWMTGLFCMLDAVGLAFHFVKQFIA